MENKEVIVKGWKAMQKNQKRAAELNRLKMEREKNYKPENCLEKQLARYKKHMQK